MMTINHREFGQSMSRALITQKDGKRNLSPWVTLEGEDSTSGRFAELLPPESALKNKELVKVARAFLAEGAAMGIVKSADGRGVQS